MPANGLNKAKIEKYFKLAVEDLYKNDLYLLESGHELHEQAISHRLAVYLEKYFKHLQYYKSNELSVDCEYNKNGNDSKKIYGCCYNCIGHNDCFIHQYNQAHVSFELPTEEKSCRPDIVVHKRGCNAPTNVLIVEIKKTSNPSSTHKRDDLMKLSAFTCGEQDEDKPNYHYQIGFYIEYNQNQANVIKFEDGHKDAQTMCYDANSQTWR